MTAADTPTHHAGVAGEAWEVHENNCSAHGAGCGGLATWFIDAPGQSIGWRHYLLSVVHLRPADNLPPPWLFEPGATHEFMVFALDPRHSPSRHDNHGWKVMTPANFAGQYMIVPDDPDRGDDIAREVASAAARGVVGGALWAEPPLSGQTEPWHTALQTTIVHLRDGHCDGHQAGGS